MLISCFCQYSTPLVLTQNYLQRSLCRFQCRQPQAVSFYLSLFFFWLEEVMNGRLLKDFVAKWAGG